MSPANSKSFTSFPISIPFTSFSALIAVAKTSKTMLNSSGQSGHPCLVPDFRGNVFSFSPLKVMLAVGLSYICMEIQKTSNSQSNLEKEEWNWRNQPAWLQALLQSHSHQDSMVLAQRQIYRSMEQNRKPRDKSMNLWTPYLLQRRQGYTIEKRQPL